MLTLADLEIVGPYDPKRLPGYDLAQVIEGDYEVLVRAYPKAATLPDASQYRFRADAERMTHLEHRHLGSVLGVGVEEGVGIYAVVEPPPGKPLGKRLRKAGYMVPEEAVSVARKVALALHYLHANGVVHRNVAPGSIRMDAEGEPLLGDYAFLHDLEPDQVRPTVGCYMGDPDGWSPEQVSGKLDDITPATDVYGLGATLYAMLTGRAPFGELDELDRREAILKQPVPAPSTLQPRVPPELDAICLKCLQKDPAQRYPSAGALADDLSRWERQEPMATTAEPARRAAPRGLLVLVGVVGACLLVSNLVTTFLVFDVRSQLEGREKELRVVREKLQEREDQVAQLEDRLGRTRLALARARSGEELTPDPGQPPVSEARRQAEALFNQGFARTLRGAYEAAIRDFTAALEFDPGYAKALVNRGYAYAQLGDHEAAIADFDRALMVDDHFAEAWSNRGNSHQALGNFEAAVSDYGHALAIDPRYARAYANRATALFNLSRWEEAVEDCGQALAIDPDYAQALACRGLSLARLGRKEEAIHDLQRCLTLEPNHARAASLREELKRLQAPDAGKGK